MDRAGMIARWFGINAGQLEPYAAPAGLELPAAGQIVLITGASGSGKSTLLRQLRRRVGRRCLDLERRRLAERPVVELFDQVSLEEAMGALSRVGLAEARTWLLTPSRLSAGQRWRLRLALASVHPRVRGGRPVCLVCDEFAALLDRITASIVAQRVRRLVDGHPNLSAILATGHDDLEEPLGADFRMECDFGRVVMTSREDARATSTAGGMQSSARRPVRTSSARRASSGIRCTAGAARAT